MSVLKSFVAPVLEYSLPTVYLHCRRMYHRRTRYGRIIQSLGRDLEWRVAAGPFAGMRYRNTDPAHRPTTKLLGAYESELHDALFAAIETRPRVVINIGCAEGYYAVGLALALPQAEIYAFDLSAHARAECRATAEVNGVTSRIRIAGRCGHDELSQADQRTLIVCDVEGCEGDLLDPERAPALRTAAMLVELHDFLRPGTTELLIERFDASHRITIINAAARNPSLYPALSCCSWDDARLALDEARAVDGEAVQQRWAWFAPLS
jgi:hypothetical protein